MAKLTPGAGYLEAGVAAMAGGPETWLELGARPAKGWRVFGRAFLRHGEAGALAAARYDW